MHIISPVQTKYANEKAKIMLESIVKLFAVLDIKLVTLGSATDSIMPATRESPNLKITIFKTGEIIVKNITIKPEYPIAFLINTLLAIIILKPSARYPPTIGI